MANTHHPHGPQAEAVDPLSHLDLLNRSKSVPEYEAFLDFGPWWYSPLFATVIGGSMLWSAELPDSVDQLDPVAVDPVVFVAETQVVFLFLAAVAGVVLVAHWLRNRTVVAKTTKTTVLLSVVAAVLIWVVVAGWGTALSTIGYEDFVFGRAAIAWALTTAFFTALRFGLGHIRKSRRVAAG